MDRIFKSKYSLVYQKQDFEEKFLKEMNIIQSKYNIISSVILLITIIAFLITQVFYYLNTVKATTDFTILIYFAILTFFTFISIFVSIKYRNKEIIQNIVTCFTIITFQSIVYIFVIKTIYVTDEFYSIFIILLMVVKFTYWNTIGVYSYRISFLANIVYFTISWLSILVANYFHDRINDTNLSVIEKQSIQADYFYSVFMYSGQYIILLFLVIFSYFTTYGKKVAFYYQLLAEMEMDWYYSIIANVDNGYLKIKNKEITAMNTTLINKLANFSSIITKDCQELFQNNLANNSFNSNCNLNFNIKCCFSQTAMDNILDYLLMDLESNLFDNNFNFKLEDNENIDNAYRSNVNKEGLSEMNNLNLNISNNTSFSDKFLRNFQSKYLGFKTFTFIGTKTMKEKDKNLIFEISARCFKDQLDEICFELIFNDLTRTIVNEKKNAEFMFKSLFLSKVAHEFKNPLICVNELLDQISDNLNTNQNLLSNNNNKSIQENKNNLCLDPSNSFLSKIQSNINRKLSSNKAEDSIKDKFDIKNTLQEIKALSNFMLILVKDLDYFSSVQLDKKPELELTSVSLEEILQLCKQIAKGLLAKNSKVNIVKFKLKKSNELPEYIFTDEIKLKQILINLISNAVKFTKVGTVVLEVELEANNQIKFIVSDTRGGIRQDIQDNLFKPFIKSSENYNKIGSGLGLNIVKDLINQFKTEINFESNEVGTKFWFSICAASMSPPKAKISKIFSQNIKKSHSPTPFAIKIPITNNKTSDKPDKRHIDKLNLDEDSNDNIKEEDFDDRLSTRKLSNMKLTYDLIDRNKQFQSDAISLSEILENESEVLTKDGYSNIPVSNQLSKNSNLIKSKDTSTIINISYIQNNHQHFLNKSVNNHIASSSDSSLEEITIKIPNNIKSTSFNIIVVDDEKLTRQSAIRMLKRIAKENDIIINICEAADGIECLYKVYEYSVKGEQVSAILSDETMDYMNGSTSAKLLIDMFDIKHNKIPFYILTAYEDKLTRNKLRIDCIRDVYSKPLNRIDASFILNNINQF